MNLGLLASWDRISFTLALGSSYTRSSGAPGVTNSGILLTKFDDNPNALTEGIRMECESGYFALDVPPGEKWKYRLYLRWHPDWTGSPWTKAGSGFKASMSQELRFIGLDLYAMPNGGYRLVVQSVEWYVEGALERTLSGFTIDSVGALAPARIPVIGVPAKILAGSSLSDAPTEYAEGETITCVEWVSGNATTGTETATGTATATGGWSFRLDGVDYDLPVSLSVLSPPFGSGCPFGLALPSLSVADTASVSASADVNYSSTIALVGDELCGRCPDGSDATPPSTIRWWSKTVSYTIRSSGAMTLPNLTKGVTKLGDATGDYEALIERFQFPRAEASASRTCANLSWSGCPCPEIHYDVSLTTAVRNQAHSHRIEVVGEAAAGVEDPFAEATSTPYGASALRIDYRTFIARVLNPGGCQAPPPLSIAEGGCCAPTSVSGYYRYESVSSTFPSITMIGGEPGIYTHNDPEATYINFHAHPHASMFYHFPKNTDTENWKALGSKRNSEDYWMPLRQQYTHLTGNNWYVGVSSYHRPDLSTAPLMASISSTISTEITGVRNWWWGISRFSIDERAPDSSITVNSSSASRWSATGATMAHGSAITLEPSGTSVTLSFDLESLNVPPYLYPAAAKSVTIPAFPANVTAVNVYLEGQAGDRALITSSTAGGTFDKPTTGNDSIYAGTWSQSFLIESGADVASGGVSDATFESPTKTHVPDLITGLTGARLVYEMTLASATTTVIDYPTFTFASTDANVFHITGQTAALLWTNAPGIRWGQLDVYDINARDYRGVPLYRPPGTLCNALDYIAWRNLIYEGDGVQAGSESDLALWYTDAELGYPDNTRVFGAASDTMAVPRSRTGVKGGQWLITNALREIFPLACFPHKERDSATLLYVSPIAFDQRAYAIDIKRKRYISHSLQMDLVPEGLAAPITSAATITPPTPWRAREHAQTLTNDEDADRIFGDYGGANEKHFASGRRWHGYFGTLPVVPSKAMTTPTLCQARDGSHFRLFSQDGSLRFGRAGNDIPKTWEDSDLVIAEPSEASIAVNNLTGRIAFVAVGGGSATLYVSDDRGVTWSTQSLGSADHAAVEFTHEGTLVVATSLGSTITITKKDALLQNVATSSLSATATRVGVSAIAEVLYLVTVEGGSAVLRISTNGGVSFGTPITVGAANYVAVEALESRGCAIAFGDGAVSFAKYDERGTQVALASAALSLDSGVGFDIAECVVGRGEWRLAVLGSRDGDLAFLTSSDLSTWS